MTEPQNGAAEAVTEGNAVSNEAPAQVETPQTTQQEAAPPDLDDQLSAIYDNSKPPRAEDGKFAPRAGDEQAKEPAETVSEGKPENETVETAQKPSIDAPISLPSELKAQWASVPPAMQEHIAKREAETHRAITQLGQQAKAYEPFGRLVESNRDVFQNQRRNVPPVEGISQLLEAQRQLDRDPVASIAHIARVYGVDLSVFYGQQEGQGNQSPELASLSQRNSYLEQEIGQLKQLVLSREDRERQANETALMQTVEQFLADKALDDDTLAEMAHHIEVLNKTQPHLSQKEKMQQALEKAQWSNPAKRSEIIAKEKAAEESRKAKEQAEAVSKAKKAGSINVKSSPGNASPARSIDEELSQTWDRMRSA